MPAKGINLESLNRKDNSNGRMYGPTDPDYIKVYFSKTLKKYSKITFLLEEKCIKDIKNFINIKGKLYKIACRV